MVLQVWCLRCWSLPSKIRHLEFSQVEVALPMVFGNWIDLLEHRIDDAGRHRDTPLVVEKYVVIAIAFVRSCDLAHSVRRPGYISQIPAALDTAINFLLRSYVTVFSKFGLVINCKRGKCEALLCYRGKLPRGISTLAATPR